MIEFIDTRGSRGKTRHTWHILPHWVPFPDPGLPRTKTTSGREDISLRRMWVKASRSDTSSMRYYEITERSTIVSWDQILRRQQRELKKLKHDNITTTRYSRILRLMCLPVKESMEWSSLWTSCPRNKIWAAAATTRMTIMQKMPEDMSASYRHSRRFPLLLV